MKVWLWIMILLALVLHTMFVHTYTVEAMRLEAIKNGCAEFNTTTGEFQWIKTYD